MSGAHTRRVAKAKGDYAKAVQTGKKACGACKTTKPLSDFPTGRKLRDGRERYSYCRPCHAEYQFRLRLARLFGLTPDDHKRILEYQDGGCAICARPQSTSDRRFAVDHRHKDGLVRGILCTFDNRLLGIVRENLKRLRGAVAYLESPPAPRALGREVYGRKGRVQKKSKGSGMQLFAGQKNAVSGG